MSIIFWSRLQELTLPKFSEHGKASEVAALSLLRRRHVPSGIRQARSGPRPAPKADAQQHCASADPN